jgi:hypothetical protein
MKLVKITDNFQLKVLIMIQHRHIHVENSLLKIVKDVKVQCIWV